MNEANIIVVKHLVNSYFDRIVLNYRTTTRCLTTDLTGEHQLDEGEQDLPKHRLEGLGALPAVQSGEEEPGLDDELKEEL